MQIFVLGMHRSGTSAVTRLINMMGVYFGPEGSSIGFNDHNPKGYWERKDLLVLNRQLLNTRSCSWFDVSRWPVTDRPAPDPRLSHGMRAFVLDLDAHRPWLVKDPRLCITLEDWLPALEAPLAVIVSRDPLEVARSLEQRENIPIDYGIALWEYYAVHTIRNAARMPRIFTTHEQIVTSPVAATRALYDGLKANDVRRIELPADREILAFIEPKLHRARRADVSASLTAHQLRIDSMMRGAEPLDAAVEVSDESRKLTVRDGPALKLKLNALYQAAAATQR
ncbi:MAG: hypothetical protein ABI697_09175 [Devosia sp.]